MSTASKRDNRQWSVEPYEQGSDTKELSSTNPVATASPGTGLAYYNFDKIYSFNAVYNFLVGARGLGKTYGAKLKAIQRALKYGEEFIYLRRYKDELKESRASFFADIFLEFPDWDFRVNGKYAEASPASERELKPKDRTWTRIGYFMPLSTAQGQKSVSFPLVRTIIFDEFIIEKGMVHYLPNEAVAFTNFFSTVDRNKDKTRVFFLANSVSIDNPYFIHYKIEPKPEEEFIRKFDGFMVCHFADSTEFKAGVYKTKFGKFIAESDPEYANYAVGNDFADNHGNLLNYKPSTAGYIYSLETKSGVFSVWIDWRSHKYYIQEKRPRQELLFTICPEKMSEGKKLLFYTDKQLQLLRSAFKSEQVYFDKARARNAFLQIFIR